MSVFQPIDPRVGNDRRKALLAKLSARMGGGVGSAGQAGGAVNAVGNPFRHGNAAMLTQLPRELPPGLAALLGPGGVGRAMANEHSSVVGAPIDRPHPMGPPPGVPQGPPPSPMPTIGQPPQLHAPDLSPVGGGPPATPSAAPTGGVNPGVGGVAPTPPAAQNPAMTTAATPNLVPLGNGMMWDPTADTVINASAPSPGVFAY